MQHKEGFFKGLNDFNIYYQCWLPKGEIKTVLLVANAFAEHKGRYNNLVDYYIPKDYSVICSDGLI